MCGRCCSCAERQPGLCSCGSTLPAHAQARHGGLALHPTQLCPAHCPTTPNRAGMPPENPRYSWLPDMGAELAEYLDKLPLSLRLPAYQILVVVSWDAI